MSEKREDETQTAFVTRVIKEQGAADFAGELRERLVDADQSLRNHIYTLDRTDTDRARIEGKAEGVRLAMSYLDEMTRGL